jgi:hypothetical protein
LAAGGTLYAFREPAHIFGPIDPAEIEAGGLRETEGSFGWRWRAEGTRSDGTRGLGKIDPGMSEARDKFLAWRRAEEGPARPQPPALWRTHTGAFSPPCLPSVGSGPRSLYTPLFKSILQSSAIQMGEKGPMIFLRGRAKWAFTAGQASDAHCVHALHKPHATNAANAACGSCFNLNTVCLDKPSALAMIDRLGGLALSSRT